MYVLTPPVFQKEEIGSWNTLFFELVNLKVEFALVQSISISVINSLFYYSPWEKEKTVPR